MSLRIGSAAPVTPIVRTKVAQAAAPAAAPQPVKAPSVAPQAPPYTTGLKVKNIFSGLGLGLLGGGALAATGGLVLGLTGLLGGGAAGALLGFGLIGGPLVGAVLGYCEWRPTPADGLLHAPDDQKAIDALNQQLQSAPTDAVWQRALTAAIQGAQTPQRASAIAQFLRDRQMDFRPALDRALALSPDAPTTLAIGELARKLASTRQFEHPLDGSDPEPYHPPYVSPAFYHRLKAKADDQAAGAQ